MNFRRDTRILEIWFLGKADNTAKEHHRGMLFQMALTVLGITSQVLL